MPRRKRKAPASKRSQPPSRKRVKVRSGDTQVMKMTGRGNYGTKIGDAISSVAPLGNMVIPGSGSILSMLGAGVRGISSLFGSGAYSAGGIGSKASITRPVFSGPSEMEVIHREFLGDISASTAFALSSFAINPGLFSTFPWLSQLAVNFEQYELMGLVFEYVSSSATSITSGTNTAMGMVILATNYDVLDADFATKQGMESYDSAISVKPSDSAVHYVECARRKNVLDLAYIRTGSIPSNADQRMYDLGKFSIATVGMQNSNVIGELWVSYKVKLVRPRLPIPQGINLLQFHASSSAAGGVANATPLGTTVTVNPLYSLQCAITSGTTITFPSTVSSGAFTIMFLWTGSTTLVTAPAVTYTSGCVARNFFVGGNTTVPTFANYGNSGATSTNLMITLFFTVTAPSAVITVSTAGTLPTGSTSMDVFICQNPSLSY